MEENKAIEVKVAEIKAAVATEADKLRTEGQRKINLIWEATQASIALLVVLANITAAFKLDIENGMLSNSFFLVIGFYFGRTNHARAGDPLQKG